MTKHQSGLRAGLLALSVCALVSAGCEASRDTENGLAVSAQALLGVSACPPGANIIQGTNASEVLTGTAGADCILGKGGNDTIYGLEGDDTLIGGSGQDTLYGGDGNDRLEGETYADALYGGAGDDQLFGGPGADDLSGGDGADTLSGQDGADNCWGGSGDDLIRGEGGADEIWGDEGDDVLFGGTHADTIRGGNGRDVILGEDGNDRLYGEADDDYLIGGAGKNTIDGGTGIDACTGTSCEAPAPASNGCTSDAACAANQQCVIAAGLCIACADGDADGTCDAADLCAADPAKVEPGQCGCGIADTDSDGDETADCNDGCPADAGKIVAGSCGCGVSDADSDGDGSADCNDGCPADATKIEPGTCGCGVSDDDTNGDGVCDDLVALTIEFAGNGGGRVVSSDATIDCTETCTVGVDPEAEIELTATADAASQLVALKGIDCAGTGPCRFAIGEQASITAVFVTGNIAFVTSTTSNGNLGGLSGADARCMAHAAAAGLPGNYVAFLSTTTVPAINRLSGARGWWRTDGLPFLDRPEDIPLIKSFYPPAMDEFGDAAGSFVTGTAANGGLSLSDHCQNWTSAATSQIGRVGSTRAAKWHSATRPNCSIQTTLLCMQVDRVSAIVVPPTPSRLAFLTADPIGLAGVNGVSDLDQICQAEAEQHGFAEAGLPAFRALVRDGQTPPAQRFDLNGLPWSRPDNVLLMESAAALATQGLIAPPSVASDGTYLPMEPQDTVMWTGAAHWNSTANPNCSDWTTSNSQMMGTVGSANNLAALSNYRTFTCDQTAHLLCLEQ